MDIDHQSHPEDIFEDLTNAEQNFYAEGYESGYAHGKLHGLFEGRELGREKGWEIWEEVGFYDGWAGMWARILERKGVKPGGRGKESRALNHARVLGGLISKFPMINPSETAKTTISTSDPIQDLNTDSEHVSAAVAAVSTGEGAEGQAEKEVDMATLLSTIRARYRLLCTSLNVRPRLTTASTASSGLDGLEGTEGGAASGVVEGIEGPMKGVDTRQLRF